MQLSLQAENTCSWVVVRLQIHGGDVTSLAIESGEKITRRKKLYRSVVHNSSFERQHSELKLFDFSSYCRYRPGQIFDFGSYFSSFMFLALNGMFVLFAIKTDKISGIPDEPPAVVRLPQHLHHGSNGHRHLIIFLSGVASHSAIEGA